MKGPFSAYQINTCNGSRKRFRISIFLSRLNGKIERKRKLARPPGEAHSYEEEAPTGQMKQLTIGGGRGRW